VTILVAVVGLVIGSILIGRLAYQLRKGKLYDRRWRAYTNRQENPQLYWSSVILESVLVLMLLSFWILVVVSTRN
jgi:hypothetical protein